MTAPLARQWQDQPGEFVETFSSGRSEPRRDTATDDFRHDMRFNGAVGGLGISVYCQPCHQGMWIDDGHDITDLIRLVSQHAGISDVAILTTEVLLDVMGGAVRP